MSINANKPLFVLFIKKQIDAVRNARYIMELDKYLEEKLKDDFIYLVVPVQDQNTSCQIFYPNGSEQINIDDLIQELAKKCLYKNVKLKFEQ